MLRRLKVKNSIPNRYLKSTFSRDHHPFQNLSLTRTLLRSFSETDLKSKETLTNYSNLNEHINVNILDTDELSSTNNAQTNKNYNSVFKDIMAVTKFKLSVMNASMVGLGYLILDESMVGLGTVFVSSLMASCALQSYGQVIEKDVDVKMKRTQNRPIVKGRLDQRWVMNISHFTFIR